MESQHARASDAANEPHASSDVAAARDGRPNEGVAHASGLTSDGRRLTSREYRSHDLLAHLTSHSHECLAHVGKRDAESAFGRERR
jgi:hypothetical protein